MNRLKQSMSELAAICEAVNAIETCPYHDCDGECWFCLGVQEIAAIHEKLWGEPLAWEDDRGTTFTFQSCKPSPDDDDEGRGDDDVVE